MIDEKNFENSSNNNENESSQNEFNKTNETDVTETAYNQNETEQNQDTYTQPDFSKNNNEGERKEVVFADSFEDNSVKDDPCKVSGFVYSDGTAYTKDADDGTRSHGYEWNSNTTENDNKSTKKEKRAPSQRGFRVFLGIVLSIFTLSVVTMTAMVADFIFDEKEDQAFFITSNNADNSGDNNKVSTNSSNYVVYDTTLTDGSHLTIPQISAKCSPSSVGIISQVEVTYSSFPFSFIPSTGISQASGSGFVYSSDGYIITNHHVIEDANKITVIFPDKTELEAELVGSDALSDIAVLKVTPKEGMTLIPMEIGNSDELVVGETVVAIGCPAGIEFMGTVTDGIVSSINRDVKITDNYGTTEKTMTLIQTNATINHGNSGGPLINTRGQVIGINTLKLTSDYEGIGFSIPINGAMPIIRQLIEHGKVIERTQDDFAYGKGIIGINGSPISQAEAEQFGIPMGVLVVQIDRDSSAAKQGLRRGDIITHYNGKEVKTVDDINAAKGSGRPGEEVTVTVYRDGESNKGETFDITFTLDSAS